MVYLIITWTYKHLWMFSVKKKNNSNCTTANYHFFYRFSNDKYWIHAEVWVFDVWYRCFNGTHVARELLWQENYTYFNWKLDEIKNTRNAPMNYFMEACKFTINKQNTSTPKVLLFLKIWWLKIVGRKHHW